MNNRLPEPYGSLIDRTRSVTFRFEGRAYTGLAGDTIASALAANGQWMLSRSFKYHRPRGVLTMAGQDANTLVQLAGEANVQADTRPISEDVEVTAQNVTGGLEHDRDAFMDRAGRFFPVGFYYRTFFRPGPKAWLKIWEPLIRRKAGLGVVDVNSAPAYYDKIHRFCDVMVVGGGPAGLSAAIDAADGGATVLLVDENRQLGGSLTFARFNDPARASELLCSLSARVAAHPGITVMSEAACNGWYADNWLPIIQKDRLHKVRAREVIVATGSIEQPATFRNNDLPGIMLGSAAQRLMRHYAVRPGSRAVVFAGNRDGYWVALDLLAAGVQVAAVLDPRDGGSDGDLAQLLVSQSVGVRIGWCIREAEGTRGNRHVRRVLAAPNGAPSGEWINCDLVCVSVGFMPAYHLPLQAGATVSYADAQFRIESQPARMEIAGSAADSFSLESVTASGRRAAARALRRLGLAASAEELPDDDEGNRRISSPSCCRTRKAGTSWTSTKTSRSPTSSTP